MWETMCMWVGWVGMAYGIGFTSYMHHDTCITHVGHRVFFCGSLHTGICNRRRTFSCRRFGPSWVTMNMSSFVRIEFSNHPVLKIGSTAACGAYVQSGRFGPSWVTMNMSSFVRIEFSNHPVLKIGSTAACGAYVQSAERPDTHPRPAQAGRAADVLQVLPDFPHHHRRPPA